MSTNAWSIKRTYVPELPKVKTERVWFKVDRNMNNLPATVTINGTVWTRTAQASENGTYSYGSNGGTSSDIATNEHYTVSPVGISSAKIYNIHYTIPGSGGGTRYYYYPDEKQKDRFQPSSPPDEVFRALKFMVDKLYFTWTWTYTTDSAYGPATRDQL